jgi:hypothetical protein
MQSKDNAYPSSSKDYAEYILGLSPPYSEEQARQAYRAAIAANHPDLANANGQEKEDSAKNMLAINEAWQVLKKSGFDRSASSSIEFDQIPDAFHTDDLEPVFEHENYDRIRWSNLKEMFPSLKLFTFMLKVMSVLGVLSFLLGMTYRLFG